MMRIGITGSTGFIGSHLASALRRHGGSFVVLECPRAAFEEPVLMRDFAAQCDQVVHLAAVSRHPDGAWLLAENVRLTEALTAGLRAADFHGTVWLGSTTHEAKTLPYHESKRRSRALLEAWAARSGGRAVTLLMPNVFGPCGKPFFNSVVATFAHLAARGRTPERIDDVELKLISIGTLCRQFRELLSAPAPETGAVRLADEYSVRLPAVWNMLENFRAAARRGETPAPRDGFERDLWETFAAVPPSADAPPERK